jgi:hypothetical protein
VTILEDGEYLISVLPRSADIATIIFPPTVRSSPSPARGIRGCSNRCRTACPAQVDGQVLKAAIQKVWVMHSKSKHCFSNSNTSLRFSGPQFFRLCRIQLWCAKTITQYWQAKSHVIMLRNIWRYYSWIGARRENASSWQFTKRPLQMSEKVE